MFFSRLPISTRRDPYLKKMFWVRVKMPSLVVRVTVVVVAVELCVAVPQPASPPPAS